MTDAFALLGETRRPWLDPDTLKARFHELSSPCHPDRFHSASVEERDKAQSQFAELSSAFHILKEPRERLLHLLELESGGRPKDIQRIPPGTMDLFVEIGQTCRDADAFLQSRTEAPSPMLKLKQLQQSLDWNDRLTLLQQRVNAKNAELELELKGLNAVWAAVTIPVGDPARSAGLPLERLEQLYRAMSYVGRWTEQLRERLAQLAV
jgi:curved DNA-binding protein CbpA